MMLAARGAFLAAQRKPTAKSYVQDGLVAMWDGIENAGWGVHDAAATTWKNLVESSEYPDFDIKSGGTWAGNCLLFSGLAAQARSNWPTFNYIDLVYRLDSGYVDFAPNQRNRMRWFQWGGIDGAMFSGGAGGSGLTSKAFRYSNFAYSVPNSLCMQYSGNDISKLYVNGTEMQSTGTRHQSTVETMYTSIGSRIGVSSSYNTGAGAIWRIAIYSRALTAAEVAANYAVDKARFNLPDAT